MQRPSTAPGKIRTLFQGDGNIGEKNYSDRFKNKIGKLAKEANRFLNDIPETEAAEKFYELEQELEVILN